MFKQLIPLYSRAERVQTMWKELDIELPSKVTLTVITVTIALLSVATLLCLNHEELVRELKRTNRARLQETMRIVVGDNIVTYAILGG